MNQEQTIRIQKIRTMLYTLGNEIRELEASHYLFWELQRIIDNSDQLRSKPGGQFFTWIGTSFIESAAVRIRRLVDKRKDAVSFLKLFDELGKTPLIITRDYVINARGFSKEHPAYTYVRGPISDTFDEWVGKDKDHLERAQIDEDRNALKEKARSIIDFTNHYFTHTSSKPFELDKPTLNNITDCLEHLKYLYRKYHFLILGEQAPHLDATLMLHANWKEIFHFAWIDQGN